MPYYHCSPTAGLHRLEPGTPRHFDKPSYVYMTTSLPMALFYGIRNFEYTYGYRKTGQLYYAEYFPDALRALYAGKSASLYLCAPEITASTEIPNEVVSAQPVPILEEIAIPDVCEALLEQERLGTLAILRYSVLTPEMRAWVRDAEAAEIRSRGLLRSDSPMAAYLRAHYPESWTMCEQEEGTSV